MAVVVTVAKGYDLDYIWKNQGRASAERSTGGYYINAAQAGEAPGRWWGLGAQALGLSPGQVVKRAPYKAVYQQRDPQTGDKLGRPRGSYARLADHMARAAGRRAACDGRASGRAGAGGGQGSPPARRLHRHDRLVLQVDLGTARIPSGNARRAQLAGDQRAAAYWAGQEKTFQEVLHRGNRAALEYLQMWAGVTRTGYHGTRVDGQEPGWFEEAGLIVTSWLQGTSRDGDPQDHIHNQIARITRTISDGKWRAHDTASLRAVLGALQAVAATTVECELAAEFGVSWVPRADGRGNEIAGITQAQMDAYSTRTVQVREKERELARRGSGATGGRRTHASCTTSRTRRPCSHAKARTRFRSTGTR